MEKNKYNDYYQNVAELSSDLFSILSEEMKLNIENSRFDEEEEYYKRFYTAVLSACDEIHKNSLAILIYNGVVPKIRNKNSSESILNSNLSNTGIDCVYMIQIKEKKYEINNIELKNILEENYNIGLKESSGSYSKIKQSENAEKTDIKDESIKVKSFKKIKVPLNDDKNKKIANGTIKVETKVKSKNEEGMINNLLFKEHDKVKKNEDTYYEPKFSLNDIEDEFNDLLLDEKFIEIEENDQVKKNISKQIGVNSIIPDKISTTLKVAEESINNTCEQTSINKNLKLVKPDLKTISERNIMKPVKSSLQSNDFKESKSSENKEIELNKKTENLSNFISPKDLIVDNYIIKYINKSELPTPFHGDLNTIKSNLSNKTISVLVTPLHLEYEDCFTTQIMVLAKSGSEIRTFVSEDYNRPSVQVKINDESFIVRGSWVNGEFQSLLYPQNNSEYEIIKSLNSIRPEIACNAGHNISYIDDNIIHIFPLSSKNNDKGYVNIMVGLENKKNNLYKIDISSHNNKIVIESYEISAKWEDGKLISSILKS
ncbi:hypothetical protein [Lacrimispora amygdalina]|uniref:hypothetical protein n=1 Tax=Lacrimispora amygdalina TaxID=253257 RepID=UPI00114510FF|nr:hypothetical protein [Lacrimispora amygdalina]